MNAEGNSIEGTWSQGVPLPLNLTKATPETAWTIPDPPPPPKPMAADAKPGFEVATIKPSARPGGQVFPLVNRSGMLNTTTTTLADLIKFAYDLHPRQITKGPAWLESEKFDITAKPDTAGMPNPAQLKMMIQKLLKERFQLNFHNEKKELSVYAITSQRQDPSLPRAKAVPTFPGFFGRRTARHDLYRQERDHRGIRQRVAGQHPGTARRGSDRTRRRPVRFPAEVDARSGSVGGSAGPAA